MTRPFFLEPQTPQLQEPKGPHSQGLRSILPRLHEPVRLLLHEWQNAHVYIDVVGIRLYWNPRMHEYTEENGDTFISSTDIKACFMNTGLNTFEMKQNLKCSCGLIVWLSLKKSNTDRQKRKHTTKTIFKFYSNIELQPSLTATNFLSHISL